MLLIVVACGGSSPGGAQGPTTASVAVQPGDLPSDMHKCDLSGDLDSFVAKLKAKDPNQSTTFQGYWDAAKKDGATAAYVTFYSDSAAHCTGIESSSSDIASATYKLVINFVIQFKDEASAAKGYTTDSFFGFSAASLKGGGAQVDEGVKTGLSANSVSLSINVANQSFYVAVWQSKSFMVILAVLNADQATGKKVALAENSRIK